MFARTTFLPTLAYNLLRNRWTSWNWYDRIDDTVVLGALPFLGPVTQTLLSEENIRSVISMNEDFELRFTVSNREFWQRLGIPFLQLNTPDILHSPAQDKLEQGVEFIFDQQRKFKTRECVPENDLNPALVEAQTFPMNFELPLSIKNKGMYLKRKAESDGNNNSTLQDHMPSVYVHCKAGRTRSATLVACYLIKRYGLTPEESVRFMTRRRSQVFLHTKQWQAIEEYYKRNGTLHRTASQNLQIKTANFDVK
ncbi:Phosphatidylglycerophosphatase and protein-tyrosine phosphatase 1 [Tyrophagus putrescentiae]|nr:Phosphatidylglycerophosphatase and protein-tyrosine phosphatase 1 [Tyrophagus putrescentiae]